MSPTPLQSSVATKATEDHWAAWQERGVENDRAAKRKLMIMTAIVLLSGAIFSGVWLLR